MQLHQLRYLIAVAETGSFRAASSRLFVSQSSVSVAVKDLEREMGVTVFERTARGVVVTKEGAELLAFARNVTEQADLMERHFAHSGAGERVRLGVSSQHYSLVVDAFGDFVNAREDASCEFTLRETHTNEIIRDVQELRSDLGVIYRSNYNERVLGRALTEAKLIFKSLYVARPHILVRSGHALAGRDRVTVEELAPYYRFEHEQGMEGSTFFAEEPLAGVPSSRRIVIDDNSTLATLLECTDGYALGTGAFKATGSVTAVPIETDEVMDVGYICRSDTKLGGLAAAFLKFFARRIADFDGHIEVSEETLRLIGEEAEN